MATVALSSAPSSLSRPLLPATPAILAGRMRALYSTCSKRRYAPSICCRSQPPSLSGVNFEQRIATASNNEMPIVSRLLQHGQKVMSISSLGASVLMITISANAATSPEMVPDIPANDLITPEMVPEILQNTLEVLIVAFLYFIAAPLGIFYYLRKRWFKRKMAEAIFQFGLVFLFFPGMLLFAPFINFRGAPREGAKEPWDEIRPSQ